MKKYKIYPVIDSFRAGKIYWRVCILQWNFIFPSWKWIATFESKEDALKSVNELIEAGKAIYK
jgi:hypothetical protein